MSKCEFERTISSNWPWIEPWSKDAFEVDRKRSESRDVFSHTSVPPDHVTLNEKVPKNARLLTNHLLPAESRMWSVYSCSFEFLRDIQPWRELEYRSGGTIFTFNSSLRTWKFFLNQLVVSVEQKLPVGDWMYVCLKTEDEYHVIKQYVSDENDPPKPPMYSITLSKADYESQELVLGEKPFSITTQGETTRIGLLSYETGAITPVCAIPTPNSEISELWLDGPCLYMWLAAFGDDLTVIDTLEGKERVLTNTYDGKMSVYDLCHVPGYTFRDGSVIDVAKRVAYEKDDDGLMVAGLVDGKTLYWWKYTTDFIYGKEKTDRACLVQ